MANPNRQFQVADAAALHALVRAQPLATLVVARWEGELNVPLLRERMRAHPGLGTEAVASL